MGVIQKMDDVGRNFKLKFGVMITLMVLSISIFASSAMAQLATPALGVLEGPITQMAVDPDPGASGFLGSITVNGVSANILVGSAITTPTRGPASGLTYAEMVNGPNIPGRADGFLGSTCICLTSLDIATGILTITDVFIEPTENVLIGPITHHSCSTETTDCSSENDRLEVGGVRILPNFDPRLLSPPPVQGGLEVDLSGSYLNPTDGGPTLGIAAVEGYHVPSIVTGEPDSFYYYFMEVEGANLLGAGTTTGGIAVTRARARDRGGLCQYRIEGSVQNPGAGIVDLVLGAQTFSAQAVADLIDPTTGVWAVRADISGGCSSQGTAIFKGSVPEVSTVFDVNVR